MIIQIPKACSRSELLQLLRPPSPKIRIERFRAKLDISEEELLRRQADGDWIRSTMLKLADHIITARKLRAKS